MILAHIHVHYQRARMSLKEKRLQGYEDTSLEPKQIPRLP